MSEADELQDIYRAARESKEVTNTVSLGPLLDYLWDRREEYSTPLNIWEEVLHPHSRSDKKDEPLETYDFTQSVRERCSELRRALKAFNKTKFLTKRITFPVAVPTRGYRLAFKWAPNATDIFWEAHRKSEVVVLVYPEPIFFDIQTGEYFRFLDTNPREPESAIADLKRKHWEQMTEQYGERLSDRLRATQIYVGKGELLALEALEKYFGKETAGQTRREVSDRSSGELGCCPILVGSERSNRFIEKFLKSREAEGFAYRIDPNKVGYVRVRKAKKEEKAALLTRYGVHEEASDYSVFGNPATPSPVRDRLVIVSRMPNPNSIGGMTMISSDESLAIGQVVAALTDENQMRNFLGATGWSIERWPNSFQMVFSVQIAPAGLGHSAGPPEFMASREYTKERSKPLQD